MTALGVVFDIDDTLYLERDYVRSGFRAVGEHVARSTGVDGFSDLAFALFEQGLRGHIFDETLLRLGFYDISSRPNLQILLLYYY